MQAGPARAGLGAALRLRKAATPRPQLAARRSVCVRAAAQAEAMDPLERRAGVANVLCGVGVGGCLVVVRAAVACLCSPERTARPGDAAGSPMACAVREGVRSRCARSAGAPSVRQWGGQRSACAPAAGHMHVGHWWVPGCITAAPGAPPFPWAERLGCTPRALPHLQRPER